MQIKFKGKAYLPEYMSMDQVLKGSAFPYITDFEGGAYFEKDGRPMIGEVTVILTPNSHDKIVQSQIDALNKQLQEERAESQRRQNAILDKISKLQALEFTPA